LILFLLLGNRAIAFMEAAQSEVGRRQPQVTVYALLILAALLVLDAVSVLLTQHGGALGQRTRVAGS
jgi:hypothetical protein